MVWTELRYLVLLPAFAPLVYYCLAIFSSWDYYRRIKKLPPIEPRLASPVSILKPVRGADRGVYENFASICRLDYPEYEIIFGVGECDDPVVPLIERLQREFPERSIRIDSGHQAIGSIPKNEHPLPARKGSEIRRASDERQ